MNFSPKPRIVYVLPNYDLDTGSHFFHIYEMIQQLSASGELDLFLVIERVKTPQILLGSLASKYWYSQRFSWPIPRLLELLILLIRERLRGRKYFYIHYSFYGALASWLVTRLFGGKAYYWNCGMPWFYRRSLFEEQVFRFVLRHTILVTGTAGLAKEYAGRYGLDLRRIRILHNWINLSRFRLANTHDREYLLEKFKIPRGFKVILFAHRLSRRKGVHLLPEIIRQVIEKDKNVMFIVVGSGPEGENLKLEIRNLKLEKYARLVGGVPQRDIPVYFQAADILLMPSEEEGFPHVLLEAMASGVPYVASDVGGVHEITPPELQDYLVPSNNTRLFAEKILELLSKPPTEIARVVDVEQEWVKQYDAQAVLPRFSALFK